MLRLAAGVRELHAGDAALLVHESHDAREHLDVIVFPDAEIFGTDAAFGVTAVASVKTRPAPPTARLPRCTKCQSLAKPSVLEYSHIGETNTRLEKVTPRIVSGSNR